MAATEEYKQTNDIWTSGLWLRHELIISLPLKTFQISQGVWNNNKISIGVQSFSFDQKNLLQF